MYLMFWEMNTLKLFKTMIYFFLIFILRAFVFCLNVYVSVSDPL